MNLVIHVNMLPVFHAFIGDIVTGNCVNPNLFWGQKMEGWGRGFWGGCTLTSVRVWVLCVWNFLKTFTCNCVHFWRFFAALSWFFNGSGIKLLSPSVKYPVVHSNSPKIISIRFTAENRLCSSCCYRLIIANKRNIKCIIWHWEYRQSC